MAIPRRAAILVAFALALCCALASATVVTKGELKSAVIRVRSLVLVAHCPPHSLFSPLAPSESVPTCCFTTRLRLIYTLTVCFDRKEQKKCKTERAIECANSSLLFFWVHVPVGFGCPRLCADEAARRVEECARGRAVAYHAQSLRVVVPVWACLELWYVRPVKSPRSFNEQDKYTHVVVVSSWNVLH